MKFLQFLLIYVTPLTLSISCSKSDFLDAKPDQSLVVPTTFEDFQAILDHNQNMNGSVNGQGLVPQIGDISSDDYYVLDNEYLNRLSDLNRMFYRWDAAANTGLAMLDWDRPYQCVFSANVVLDGLHAMDNASKTSVRWSELRSAALFYRAHALYHLAQVFAHPYQMKDLDAYGLPLRLSSDVMEPIHRSSVTETYQRILEDLQEAVSHLPRQTSIKERPSQPACYALIARVLLAMGMYGDALEAAEESLAITDALLNYNQLSPNANFPFLNSGVLETEVLFISTFVNPAGITSPVNTFLAKIDTLLLSSYHTDDLRKSIFFRSASPSGQRYKGSYFGSNNYFAGIANDEVYLIKAECQAQVGLLAEAVETLEKLRAYRFRTASNSYRVPVEYSGDRLTLIDFVRGERRRQLPFRGLRWTDLRRYNAEGAKIILKRKLENNSYELPVNDLRYTIMIPQYVIGFNVGMEQNPR